jgi:hypothetical protein
MNDCKFATTYRQGEEQRKKMRERERERERAKEKFCASCSLLLLAWLLAAYGWL